MANQDFCPLHDTVCGRVEKVEEAQGGRKCQDHERRIIHLEQSDQSQWNDINRLKVIVYTGAGASAFIGSIVGAILAALLKAHY
ncbi:MAG: hypothetical protein WC356_01700 [Candidatus Micrarchaeia archaeon]|jgi:hypothetical protein